MSAECGKHGVDLHGDTFNGLACPVCEVEADRDRLLRDLENANAEIEDLKAESSPLGRAGRRMADESFGIDPCV